MPNPAEVAVVRVEGVEVKDWESVWVQHPLAEGWQLFRFVHAERDPLPGSWDRLQFTAGQRCSIFLGGQLAVEGYITIRQAAYDDRSHQVMLIGKSLTWPASTSSVETKSGNFDGMSFEQCARKVLGPYPCGIKVVGSLDNTPFERLQNQPGEVIWDFLERIARPRGAVMGSDYLGNFLLIGQHSAPVVQELVEGVNILKCQAIISKEFSNRWYRTDASFNGSDKQNGRAASEMSSIMPGRAPWDRLKLTVAGQPVASQAELDSTNRNESIWSEETEIQVSATVQGWLRDGKNLWHAGDKVVVKSPMAMLNGVTLKIQTVTFTQDNRSGTLTTLDLVKPEYLRDGTSLPGGAYRTDGAPKANNEPAKDPPADTSKKAGSEITPDQAPAPPTTDTGSPPGWSGGSDTQSPPGWGGGAGTQSPPGWGGR